MLPAVLSRNVNLLVAVSAFVIAADCIMAQTGKTFFGIAWLIFGVVRISQHQRTVGH